jgi:hypothetical protein
MRTKIKIRTHTVSPNKKQKTKRDSERALYYVLRLHALELALKRQRKRLAGEAISFLRPAEELKVTRATPEEAVQELEQLITAQKHTIEAAAAAVPTRKERSTPKTMETELRVDERLDICSLYSRCVQCGQAYTRLNGHRTCKVSNALRVAERDKKEREEPASTPLQPDHEMKEDELAKPGFRIVDAPEIHSIKQTLSHSPSRAGHDGPERAAFVLQRIQHYAIEKHYLRYFAGPATQGYLVQTLQPVRMIVIDRFMPDPVLHKYPEGAEGEVGRRVMLGSERFKIALIACSKEHDENAGKAKLKCASDSLYLYCRNTFIGEDEHSAGLRQKLGSIHYISGSTLQATASSWQINYE